VFLTTGQLAEALSCNVATAKKLLNAGVLPRIEHRGVRRVVPVDVVQTLTALPPTPLAALPTGETAVLRVDAAVPGTAVPGTADPESTRSWSGFGAQLSAEDNLTGLNGWWRCDPSRVAAGQILVVTVAGFVVAVLTGLDGWDGPVEGRYRFPEARLAGYLTDLTHPVNQARDAEPADAKIAAQLLGTRLDTTSGGPVAYVRNRTPVAAATHTGQEN
jgi:hypothetical protein